MAAEQASRHTGTAADTHVALVSDEAAPDRREADDGLAQYSCQICARRKVKCEKQSRLVPAVAAANYNVSTRRLRPDGGRGS